MLGDFEMRVDGLAQLEAELEHLADARTQRRVLQRATNFAMTPVLQEARRNAPKDQQGRIPRNIRKANLKPARDGTISTVVSVRQGKALGDQDPWFWWFHELGTAHQPAIPFLRPALDSKAPEALERFKTRLAEAIDTEVKRART